MGSENILVWNVGGLNSASHRDTVWELVFVERLSIVCLQETKSCNLIF
jgi:exonuclease III